MSTAVQWLVTSKSHHLTSDMKCFSSGGSQKNSCQLSGLPRMEKRKGRQHKLPVVCNYPMISATLLSCSLYKLTVPNSTLERLATSYRCNQAISLVWASAAKPSYKKTLILSFLIISDTSIKFPFPLVTESKHFVPTLCANEQELTWSL